MIGRLSRKSILVTAVVSVVVLQISCFFIVSYAWPELSDRGLVGDLFGVTNSLFSGLGCAFLIYTILLQQEQINAQHSANLHLQNQGVEEERSRDKGRNLEMLTFLIRFYDDEINRLSRDVLAGPAAAARSAEITDLKRKRQQLEGILQLFHENVQKAFGDI